MRASLLFLGSGSSIGVPIPGCGCRVCISHHLFNKRLRPSVLVTIGTTRLLIDIGPDFRQQALKYEIGAITGLLLTHTHYDHIGGMDDIRPLFFKRQEKKIPCLCTRESFDDVKKRFDYMMYSDSAETDTKYFDFQLIQQLGEQTFCGIKLAVCEYIQFGMRVVGYRFGNLAYLTDIAQFEQSIFDHLKGVEILIISALRFEDAPVVIKSPAHFTIEDATHFARKVGAKKTWITHIAHETDHESANRALPEDVKLAHDGLEVEFTYF